MVVKNPEQYFYVCDGTELKSMEDMLNWARGSSDGSFYYHVNTERNDFAPWTKSILKDNVLAKQLDKAKSREEMIDAIEKRMASKSKSKSTRKSKKEIISKIKNAVSA